jgi:hypothetical protein
VTCIVGIAENGRVYIGGDSAGVGGLDLTVRADEKVFKNGDFLFGFTSSFRMGQLLKYSLTPPLKAPDAPNHKYLCTSFVNAIRETLKSGGYATKKDESEHGGTFLVGYQGGLYQIESDYQVGIPADGFDACGCGDQIARGSLFSTVGQDPKKRIITALEAAHRFSAGVRPPFLVLEAGL